MADYTRFLTTLINLTMTSTVMARETTRPPAVSDCVGYFESAGFENISVHEFIPNTLTRVTGIRS